MSLGLHDISLLEYFLRYFCWNIFFYWVNPNWKIFKIDKWIKTFHRQEAWRLNRSKGVQMNCPPRATQPPIPADDQWFYPFLSMITKVIKFLRTDPNAAFHTKQAVDPKFQKRRSLDHLLLKWSPMVPSFPPWSPHQPLSRLNYDTRKLIRVQGMLIAWHGMACWSVGQSGKITRKCGALGPTRPALGGAALVILMGPRRMIMCTD